jgi:hypothetical protein
MSGFKKHLKKLWRVVGVWEEFLGFLILKPDLGPRYYR